MSQQVNDGGRGDLDGQVALVTGGGRGIGRAVALALATAGAAVAVTARTPEQLRETVATIEANGGRAIGLPADVTDERAVARVVAEIERRLGPIDLLVNNAGVGGPIGPTWEVPSDEWWHTFEVNLKGAFLCARAVMPGMIAQGGGRIVNLASAAGAYRWPLVTAYAVSKAALIKLTENLAVEAKRYGVKVFAVHPGIVRTGLTEGAMQAEAPTDSPAGRVADWFRQEVAAGRDLPPERGAEVIVELARGRADVLSGRFIEARHDLAALAASAEAIPRDDLYTLRLQEPKSPGISVPG